MATGTNAFKVGNLVNSSDPLPDAGVATTASMLTVTPAGTTQATALAIQAKLNLVLNTVANAGLILPVGIRGQTVFTYAPYATTATKVYPPVGGTVGGPGSGAAANAAATLAAQSKTTWYCIDDTGLNWI